MTNILVVRMSIPDSHICHCNKFWACINKINRQKRSKILKKTFNIIGYQKWKPVWSKILYV